MSKILKYAGKNMKIIYLALVCVLLSVSLGIIPYFLANKLLVNLIEETVITSTYVITICVEIVILLILKAVTHGVGLMLSHKGAFTILCEMRKKFADKLSKQALGEVTKKGTGYFKKKFVEDIGQMEVTLAHIIPEMIPNLLVPLAVIIIIFMTDWRMGFLSMGSIPFGIIPMIVMIKMGTDKMPKYYESQSNLNNTVIEYISGMEVIKIFGRTTSSYEKYSNNVDDYRKYSWDWSKACWKNMAVVTIVLPCAIILTFPVGMYMYLQGSLSLDTFIFTLMLNMSIGIPLNKALLFMPYFPQLGFGMNSLEETFNGKELMIGSYMGDLDNKDIEYKNVSFSYEDKVVINKMSFNIKENSLVAIVGPSGGGKSTIVKLLIHYYDVNEGSISIGGHDIRDYNNDSLMNMISYVSQDNFLFNDSIMENIRLGKPEASDEEVVESAKLAASHDFIMKMEDGYQTIIGDGGGKLSGGEKQRITIARAILKDAPIIILDEATAYADAENEDLIQEAINKLMKNKTVIVIAHRLRSVVNADKIIFVKNGEIADMGNHDYLLSNSADYQMLWEVNEQSYNWKLEV